MLLRRSPSLGGNVITGARRGVWAPAAGWCSQSAPLCESSHLICLFVNLLSGCRGTGPPHMTACVCSVWVCTRAKPVRSAVELSPLWTCHPTLTQTEMPGWRARGEADVCVGGGGTAGDRFPDDVLLDPFQWTAWTLRARAEGSA